MNTLPPFETLRRNFYDTLTNVRQSRFFRDRLSIGLMVVALSVNGLNLILLALHVRPMEAQIPVRFSSLTLFDTLGPWYFPYLVALFALGVTVINSVFAYHGFVRSRLASFFLMTGAVVVSIFAFIISSAFGAIR